MLQEMFSTWILLFQNKDEIVEWEEWRDVRADPPPLPRLGRLPGRAGPRAHLRGRVNIILQNWVIMAC